MGLFSSSVSSKKIDQIVMSHFQQYLSSPEGFGQPEYEENYRKMLTSLNEWADDLKLGTWKRSTIIGSIEAILRTTFRDHVPPQVISQYVKLAQKAI